MNWVEIGKFLILAGAVLACIGVVFLFADKIPIGKLPGDIQIGNERFKIYIPIATSILLSIIITLVLNFFTKR